jgi:hypothetical protein
MINYLYEIKKNYFFLLITILYIKADHMDSLYASTEYLFYDASNYLDKNISSQTYKVDNKHLVKADISYNSIFEESQPSIQKRNIKIKFLFPRLRKKYKIIFENYNQNKAINEIETTTNYNMLAVSKDTMKIGVKFRPIKPDLFILYKYKWEYNLIKKIKLIIKNNAIYFAKFKFNNLFSINIEKYLYKDIKLSFNNSYRFQEKYDKYELTNAINIYYKVSTNQRLNYTILSYSIKDNSTNRSLEVDYYYIGVAYRNYFFKNRTYFQIDTGLTFRDENNFDKKGRIMFKLGVLFGGIKKSIK